jgi:hypothetical protein
MTTIRSLLKVLVPSLTALLQPDVLHQLVTLVTTVRRAVPTLPRTRLPLCAARRPSQAYETLSLTLRLELADPRGARAVLTRRQRVRLLTPDGVFLREVIWGEGNQLARYSVQGARRVGRRPEGAQRALLLDPERPVGVGALLTITSRRTITAGFTATEEYCGTLLERPTGRLEFTVVFPPERPPRAARLLGGVPDQVLRTIVARYDANGRATLRCRIAKPAAATPYRLQWRW